jgi:hypothetical protein
MPEPNFQFFGPGIFLFFAEIKIEKALALRTNIPRGKAKRAARCNLPFGTFHRSAAAAAMQASNRPKGGS